MRCRRGCQLRTGAQGDEIDRRGKRQIRRNRECRGPGQIDQRTDRAIEVSQPVPGGIARTRPIVRCSRCRRQRRIDRGRHKRMNVAERQHDLQRKRHKRQARPKLHFRPEPAHRQASLLSGAGPAPQAAGRPLSMIPMIRHCQPNDCGPAATVAGNWLAPGEDGARWRERRIRDFGPPLNRRTPVRTSPADRPRPCSSPKPALFRGTFRNRLPRSCATIFGAGNPPTGIR